MFSFTARPVKVVSALAGVPALAAGLWLTTAGPAQAAEQSPAPVAAPVTSHPVLIKASKLKGKSRILTVRGTGRADLSRSKATREDALTTDGTWMALTRVGPKDDPKYTIMSLNDSEEADAHCLQQKKSGALSIAVCDEEKANQLFTFVPGGRTYVIEGRWGSLRADRRQLRTSEPGESAGHFSVVRK